MKKGIAILLFFTSFFYASAQSTGKYQIKFLEINKSNSDYGLAILDNNRLIFTSSDTKIKTARKNYNPRKDLFVGDIDFDGEIKNVKLVSNKKNNKINKTGATYTSDKRTVYFSRNKYVKKLSKQKLAKNQRLELYKATLDADGNASNVQKLPFNKSAYSSGSPVLSADNTKLYFVSDRLPSQGKTDIFVVDILSNGKFSKPRNLGSNVNTSGNETTPFITDKNILYFSSDGHPGLGNLDVFAVEVYDDTTSETYQLASPINSINDDFAYIVNKDNNQGFFTSNRLQGKGFNDLYAFTLEEDIRPGKCFITVDGKVKDKETLDIIAGATVNLYNIDGELLETVSTYNDGTYKFTVSCAKEYKIVASNDNYKNDEKRIEILEENYHSALHTNLVLTRLIKKKKAIQKLQPIYYEFDDATITAAAAKEMNKIVEIMSENPDLIIETSSYTDSRGSNAYNKVLSQKRAKAAIEYLKSQGIDAQRIKSHSYGEEKLINQCVNGVDCDDEAHQMNRRTEFNFANIQSISRRRNIYKRKSRLADTPTKSKPKIQRKEKIIKQELSNVNEVASVKVKKKETKTTVSKKIKKPVQEEIIVNYRSSIVAVDKENNKALNYIENEKLKVLKNITSLEKKFELAINKFTNTSDSLSIEKENIATLKTEVLNLKETGWSNVISYKNRLYQFKKRYNDLTSFNNKIKGSINILSVADINDKKVLEESLKIKNIEVIAMKIGSKGKYQITNNASKTDLIKVKFKLLHNKNIASGKKDAHIIVQNPKGKVTEAKGIFTLKDSNIEKKYTDHTIIDYNKNDIDVTMYIQRKGKNYEKGIYPIKLFLEGHLVGVSNLNLASAF
ncbi:MAG: OmpA family protein [Flavobacteriaceae bacterium]|nr:OmpA family protein [Flavobacteriaceae bacterium]